MSSKEHTTDRSYQRDSTEQDGRLVRGEEREVRGIWLIATQQAVHHEDAIVNTDTENECGDDDADEVEAHVEQYHRSEHDEPTEQDGHKGEQRMLQIEVKTQEQYHEYKQHGDPLQHVKVVVHLE